MGHFDSPTYVELVSESGQAGITVADAVQFVPQGDAPTTHYYPFAGYEEEVRPTVGVTGTLVFSATGQPWTQARLDSYVLFQGESFDLNWQSDQSSCVASGGWSGNKAGSGTETVVAPITLGEVTYTLTCGGAVTEHLRFYVTYADSDCAHLPEMCTPTQPTGSVTPTVGTQTIQRTSYSVAGQAIAVQVSGDPDGNNGLYYLHSDHLGSASSMSDTAGQRVGEITRYTPFGETRTSSGNSAITDMGFTGHKHNDSIGLVYMNARFYVPSIGRFASADIIIPDPKNSQAFNRYSYVYNNPLTYIDPTGHVLILPTKYVRERTGHLKFDSLGENLSGDLRKDLDIYHPLNTHPIVEITEGVRKENVKYSVIVASSLLIAPEAVMATFKHAPTATRYVMRFLTPACADSDCTNELTGLQRAVQRGLQSVQNSWGQGYRSFNAFKRAHGSAGTGNAWHHIVGQNARNIQNFGTERIHNTNNLIKLPDKAGQIHRQITGYYNSINFQVTGSHTLRIREWLETKSFEFQWQFGIDTIIQFGGEQYIINQIGNGVP